jgi:hypothetical protein
MEAAKWVVSLVKWTATIDFLEVGVAQTKRVIFP